MRTLRISLRVILAFAVLANLQGQDRNVAKNFFRQSPGDRIARFRQYSLGDQYKIFRYGMDKKEPPFMDLANPIAERGEEAVPFLLGQLNTHPDDLTTRDILLIFESMAQLKTYEVKSDALLMKTVTSRVSEMKDKEWRTTCSKSIQRILENR